MFHILDVTELDYLHVFVMNHISMRLLINYYKSFVIFLLF